MFGMGLSEIFIIIVVAILFLGPDKLPDAMVQIAKFFRSLKRTVNEAKASIEEELKVNELKEEAFKYKKQLDEAAAKLEDDITPNLTTLDDLTKAVQEVKESENKLEEETKKLTNELKVEKEDEKVDKIKTKTDKNLNEKFAKEPMEQKNV